MFDENFEIESRKVEFNIPTNMPGEDLNPEDLSPEGSIDLELSVEFDLKSAHRIIREEFPF